MVKYSANICGDMANNRFASTKLELHFRVEKS